MASIKTVIIGIPALYFTLCKSIILSRKLAFLKRFHIFTWKFFRYTHVPTSPKKEYRWSCIKKKINKENKSWPMSAIRTSGVVSENRFFRASSLRYHSKCLHECACCNCAGRTSFPVKSQWLIFKSFQFSFSTTHPHHLRRYEAKPLRSLWIFWLGNGNTVSYISLLEPEK